MRENPYMKFDRKTGQRVWYWFDEKDMERGPYGSQRAALRAVLDRCDKLDRQSWPLWRRALWCVGLA